MQEKRTVLTLYKQIYIYKYNLYTIQHCTHTAHVLFFSTKLHDAFFPQLFFSPFSEQIVVDLE